MADPRGHHQLNTLCFMHMPSNMPTREIQTCTRCKDSKRRCDKLKPSCSRCNRAGQTCIYTEAISSTEPNNGLLSPSLSSNSSPLEKESAPGRVVKRRDRATLSCTRCHRLKVRCDKRQPCCSRCARLGYGRDCIFTHNLQPPLSVGPFVVEGDDAETIVSLWFLRKRGSSHWRALMTRVGSMSVRRIIMLKCSSLSHFLAWANRLSNG